MAEQQTIERKRKKGFITIATLSIVNIGFGIYDQLSAFIIGKLSAAQVEKIIDQSKKLTESMKVEDSTDLFEKMYTVQRLQNEYFLLSHGIALITLIIGLIGVILMLNKKALGFHLYIIYSLLASFGVILYIPFDSIPFSLLFVNAMLSLVLIFLYYSNRIWATNANSSSNQ